MIDNIFKLLYSYSVLFCPYDTIRVTGIFRPQTKRKRIIMENKSNCSEKGKFHCLQNNDKDTLPSQFGLGREKEHKTAADLIV